MRKTSDLRGLILGSPDPLHFCMRMINEIRHEIDPHFLEEIDPEKTRRYFFINQGWMLTGTGFNTVSRHYKHYAACECPKNLVMTGKILLNMDDSVVGPWCVRGQKVVVFDPTIHFELEMLGGDLSKYVDFKNPKIS